MTLAEDNGPERGGDDLLAAEYVLGVLPADERQIASSRIDTETDFARLVDGWEVHLSPMAAAYPEVEPPASVKPAIDRRLFASTAATPSDSARRPVVQPCLLARPCRRGCCRSGALRRRALRQPAG